MFSFQIDFLDLNLIFVTACKHSLIIADPVSNLDKENILAWHEMLRKNLCF